MSDKKSNLIFMANIKESAHLWTPALMCRDFLAHDDNTPPEERYPKAVLLVLDDRDGGYHHTGWYAKMKRSEIIALLEIVKQHLIEEING